MFRENYTDRLKAMKNGGSTQEYMFLEWFHWKFRKIKY